MKIVKLLLFIFAIAVLLAASALFLYLKVLPEAISNQKYSAKIETIVSKILDADFKIKNPKLKTELSPNVYFSFENVTIKKDKNVLADIQNFTSDLSLKNILQKEIIIKKINIDNTKANISEILKLPLFSKKSENSNGFIIDIFKSDMNIKNSDLFYQIDKENSVKLEIKNIKISDNPEKKYLSYDLSAKLLRDGHSLNISTKEDGQNTIIENKEKLIIKNSNIKVGKANVLFNGIIDPKNYKLNFKGRKFSVNNAIGILDSQIVANNLSDYLVYFKDTGGDFNFDVNVNNNGVLGTLDLNKLTFKLIPFNNLPIVLNKGNVKFDNSNIKLKNFKGFYDGKAYNSMDFDGDIKDYLKSVDTNLIGNAVVTNDFAKKYLSKMVSYPLEIQGKADTRVILKSKYNKMDLTWLYKFEQGNGFVIDGEETFINNKALRVLVAKMHLENNILGIKSLDYHLVHPSKTHKEDRIPILSMNGNIDLSSKNQIVRDFGITLTKPMPSGFVNMLLKQNLFKDGTFTGNMQYIHNGKYPRLSGDFHVNEVKIPSQRLFIKKGIVKTEDNKMKIISNGYYRRSKYDLDAIIDNTIKFPIIVEDINLSIDNMDVEKYLQAFNNQTVSEHSSENIHETISKSLEKDVENDENIQTFDLANLIIKKGKVKISKGNYKKINFSNVEGDFSFDKNSMLKLNSNRFDVAEGQAQAQVNCDLKNHKYNLILAVMRVNSDTLATELVNLPKEIKGKASGILDLNTDKTLKLNGTIKFVVQNGIIAKIGLVEYTMKVASLFRNPVVMITPSVISDLVDIPEGKFDHINGTLTLERNVIRRMVIKSVSPQLSTYIIGRYNLENQDAILRVYTRFSNRSKGAYGFLRSLSLNTLANRIPLSSRNNSNYYEAEIKELPKIEVNDKDTQIFLTKVDGDIVQNNFISSLHKIK